MTQRVAINPLQWLLNTAEMRFELDEPHLREAFAELAEVGFAAVQADVPDTMSVADYARLLADYGLQPAPGYFGSALTKPIDLDMLEAARTHAATMAALGLDLTFIADDLNPTRIARPAIGADRHDARLESAAKSIGRVAKVMITEGVRVALHPHVGSWIETAEETEFVLERTEQSVGFGPDLGHLSWAGANLAPLLERHRDRVLGVHIKDIDASIASSTKANGLDYIASTTSHRLWREPGDGDVDLTGALAMLGDAPDWFVIEVDVPAAPTPLASAKRIAGWLDSYGRFDGWSNRGQS